MGGGVGVHLRLRLRFACVCVGVGACACAWACGRSVAAECGRTLSGPARGYGQAALMCGVGPRHTHMQHSTSCVKQCTCDMRRAPRAVGQPTRCAGRR